MATESEEKVELAHAGDDGSAGRKSSAQAKAAHAASPGGHPQSPGHDDPHAAGSAPLHHSHRARYLKVFGALVVLTGLELGIVNAGLSRNTIIAMLILLAFTKAGAVALFFMHLADEKRVLRLMIGLPLLVPPFYAVVLIIEAIARASFTAFKVG